MFSGLIETMGRVQMTAPRGPDRYLRIATGWRGDELPAIGDSLAVDGVCLTVVDREADTVGLDVSAETLRCTTLGGLEPGAVVNLERALLPTTRLGGHFVSGHVDGVAVVGDITAMGESRCLTIVLPTELVRYVAAKGSLNVSGVSLTVNRIAGERVEINLIPHTQSMTTLGRLSPGTFVNIEVDLLARYLERLLQADTMASEPSGEAMRRRLDGLW